MKRPDWPGWKNVLPALAGSDHSTHNLSLAMALGAFIAPTPIVGVHTWMALGLAFLFRVNRLAAFVGSNVSNPLSLIPLTILDIKVGLWMVGKEYPDWLAADQSAKELFELLGEVYLEAWLGSIPVGIIVGIIVYGISFFTINRWRKNRS
ncbi:DUF2062 domain-containing protein [bacterium]|jgi:hypothetical protein|nr:DUF2062 domain-containing protein [bacterium]MBT4292165.1 DUF2062 domain-containing protein [bacterium]MBT7310703.1 DUF2062 domain-containing protein [bacterium]